jgi:hypothetical protein
MRLMTFKVHVEWFIIVLFNFPFYLNGLSQTRSAFEAYYLKICTYPKNATNDWNPNGTESQGVTNDGSNWYFTTTDNDGRNAHLWKIPVSIALDQNVQGYPGVGLVDMMNFPELAKNHYWHWGDPDHYKYNGIDYILVPLTSDISGKTPSIAIFRALDLNLIAYNTFPSNIDLPSIGWCAINPDGDLITSKDNALVLERFSINWSLLESSPTQLSMLHTGTYRLKDENDAPLDTLHNMQGGEFTSSGELLYISCGSGECYIFGLLGGGHGVYTTDGLHVFETKKWKEIKRSTNHLKGERSCFDYNFNNKCACLSGSQTPEGLTIWDLDDQQAPNISGQLHVLVNFYNRYAFCNDALSLQHFSGKLHVDNDIGSIPSWPHWGAPLPGTVERPFINISDAINWYPVWDGAIIVNKGDTLPNIGKYSIRVLIKNSDVKETKGLPIFK